MCSACGATRAQRFRHFGRMVEAGLRFAFYGRVSTEDYQDPVSSRRWQVDFAAELVAGRGRIVAQYFDVGYSREVSWAARPEAARLLAALADPDRGFKAIVVGEYTRAFHGSQAINLAPLLQTHGAPAPSGTGPADGAVGAVDLRPAVGGVPHRRDRQDAQRDGSAMPVGGRP